MDRTTSRELLERLIHDADRICARFGLRYGAIEAERANVKRRYGICYADGRIKIRLRHARTGKPLRYSSLVNTLCHELAHLRHFDHSPRFHAFYEQILGWARREGIYRPQLPGAVRTIVAAAIAPRGAAIAPPRSRERPAPHPEQLTLF